MNKITKLVISVNNSVGKNRRSLLNYKFVHISGCKNPPKWIADNFKRLHTESPNSQAFRNRMCCFASHVKALKYIVNNKINKVVVLEDDAFLDGSIKNPLPEDGATLLGGVLRHPSRWESDKHFIATKAPKIINKFKRGVNRIHYDSYRWTGAWAIYYPNWKVAKDILDFILSKKFKFKHYDIFLANHKLIKYLYYPSIFTHDDTKSVSQVSSKKAGVIKNYVI